LTQTLQIKTTNFLFKPETIALFAGRFQINATKLLFKAAPIAF